MSARVLLRLPAALTAPDDDRTLLSRFAAERDEASFAALVKRHGSMVFGVCRRTVRDSHLAEDAFRATFLVLARNPSAAASASSVGAWLFGVARRVGLSARRRLQREQQRESNHAPRSPKSDFDELLHVLDEEVLRLPDECRAAVVACFLREQTQDEAAKQIGWSLSTLRRRLERAKELLRSRLTRRGATLSAALLATSMAKADVPAKLLDATVRSMESPAPIAATLATDAVRTSFIGKVLAVAMVVVGGFTFALQQPPAPLEPAPAPRAVPTRSWVTLSGHIVLPNKAPLQIPRELTREQIRDADYCLRDGRRVFEENVRIHPTNLGIRNVIVWLRPDSDDPKATFPKDKIHPDLANPKPRDHEVVVTCCQFEPRVTVARTGDTMVFKNQSAITHSVNYWTYTGGESEQEFNIALRAETEYRAPRPLNGANNRVDHFSCAIHPWMKGCVRSFDHPYFALTDENGRFEIPNAPVGQCRIVMWHEKVGYREGRVGRLGHKLTIADDGHGQRELPLIPLDSEGWEKE